MGGVVDGGSAEAAEKPWYVARPDLVSDVHAELAKYPSLHLFLSNANAEVRGTFPVRDEAGRTLDEYAVAIELPRRYPNALPIVRETAGRIPWTLDRHVLPTCGTCCVLLPDARWEEFPMCAPFSEYLAGPLHNFFLGQSIVESGGEWPFGEWAHGVAAKRDYYSALFETENGATVRLFLEVLGWPNPKGRARCPCGSGRRLSKCCRAKVDDLRTKIQPVTARRAFSALGFHRPGHFRERGSSRGRR